ncbi:MAG: hypothetical protein IT367_04015 [Candidatus Hydrogenedentes bacterium]|nr:hypothetical protein [Candidatus Hydrogenedentota bacterium]
MFTKLRSINGLSVCTAVLFCFGGASQQACSQPAPELHEKPFTVRAFNNGMRAGGIVVTPTWIAPATDAPRIEGDLPAWLKRDELLGEIPNGNVTIKLHWESNAQLASDAPHYALRLANHQGYATLNQRNDRSTLTLAEGVPNAAWSEHTYAPMTMYAPGLYNALLSNTTLPRESIPLGQLLWYGQPVQTDNTRDRVREAYQEGLAAFAGSAILARWFRFELPVTPPPFAPRSLVIVSSVDWLEHIGDQTPVAEITLRKSGAKTAGKSLLLGRDTASTWYSFHSRGNVKHSQAPVAWSWRERQESVDFEASAYMARFELESGTATPDSVTVRYLPDEGVLRIYAVIFLP